MTSKHLLILRKPFWSVSINLYSLAIVLLIAALVAVSVGYLNQRHVIEAQAEQIAAYQGASQTYRDAVIRADRAENRLREMQSRMNTKTEIYQYPFQRWDGVNKGTFMSKKDAQAQGYRPTHNGQ